MAAWGEKLANSTSVWLNLYAKKEMSRIQLECRGYEEKFLFL